MGEKTTQQAKLLLPNLKEKKKSAIDFGDFSKTEHEGLILSVENIS